MRFRSTGLALIAATSLCQPAAAKDTLVLEPSSHWEIDYAEDSCALRRLFGEAELQTHLEMRRYQPGVQLQTTVATKAKTTRKTLRFRLGDEGEWVERYAMLAEFGGELEGVIFDHSLPNAPPDHNFERDGLTGSHLAAAAALEAETAATIDSLAVAGAFENDLILRTGSLKAPMAALNQCIDNLLAHWELDVEAHKTRSRSAGPVNLAGRPPVVPPPRRLGTWGPAQVRLAIDETGQVTQCHIRMPPGEPPSEERGCARIRNEIEFVPALDNDGRPMKSYYVASVGPIVTTMEVRVQSTRPAD
jgi:hypothetical protein